MADEKKTRRGEIFSSAILHDPKGETDVYAKAFTQHGTTLENFEQIFRDYIYSLSPKEGEVISLADYGAANGTRSRQLFDQAIGFIKEKHGKNRQILIVWNDLPGTDFRGLFQRLEGEEPQTLNGFQRWSDVFALASGRSMYKQIIPDNSMDIIFSCNAVLYLSTRPCYITKGITEQSGTEAERKVFAEVGRNDWENFLLLRAKELKSGGYLIIASVFLDTETESQHLPIWNKAWDQLYKDKKVTEEEYVNATRNVYYRTKEELLLPFDKPDSVVTKAGMELQSISFQNMVFVRYREEEKDKFPRKQFEESFVNGNLAIVYGTIYEALSDDRTEESKFTVIETYKELLLHYFRESGLETTYSPRADLVIKKTDIKEHGIN